MHSREEGGRGDEPGAADDQEQGADGLVADEASSGVGHGAGDARGDVDPDHSEGDEE